MTNDEYFRSEEFKNLLCTYKNGQKNGTPAYIDPDDLADIAEFYHLQGHTDEAIKILDDTIEKFPGASAPLEFRARIELLVNKDPYKAEKFADQIEDKSDLEYDYLRAEIMLVRRQNQEADEYLQSCLKSIEKSDREDFYLDVATLFADYNVMDKSHEWLMRSKQTNSDDYKELLGRIALKKGDYTKSLHIFSDLVEKNPYSGSHWNHLASSQYFSNLIKESITSSEFSIAINPYDDEAVQNKANGLFALGNYEEALVYYKKVAELCPKDGTGELFQGITLLKLNRMEEGIAHLKKAEKIADRDQDILPDIYQTLAYALSDLGDQQQAMTYIRKAEHTPAANLNELSILRGHLLMAKGELEKAQKTYQKAIYNSNFDAEIVLRVAISIYENNHVELAYGFFHTLLQNDDDEQIDGYAYLAACCKELGREEEYKNALKMACKRNPIEVKAVFGEAIPQDLDTDEYYNYLIANPDKS
ncbi:MAG: tetratricopeptide repeat protein [Hoylesella enoeca]|uniref:tetratricopeptide repeat protein n=1 Tax=Hoylesella enoeca TaxID=76123 RepID=UPI003F9FB397